MASLGANFQKFVPPGAYCFKIQGQLYHRTSFVHPKSSKTPKFAQLYILDPEQAAEQRLNSSLNKNCDANTMKELSILMSAHNPFAKTYATMRELEIEEERRFNVFAIVPKPILIEFTQTKSLDLRRYNKPTTTEVAIVFQLDENGEPPNNCDIRIYPRGDKLVQISSRSKFLDPMVYPLFFFMGDLGWHEDIMQIDPRTTAVTKRRVTQLQYYSYKLAIRDKFNALLYGGRLFQQFVVDAYVRIEANRLFYYASHQKDLRVDCYKGLMDYVKNNSSNNNAEGTGKMTILPSSFPGGPRYMHQCYQDAMAIVAASGRPDVFVTMTCDPNWRELTENLYPGQHYSDRPDLIARVFKLKLEALLKDIQLNEIFGKVKALMYSIEFQKRGLPHAHILIILHSECKIQTTTQIDSIVSATLPNKKTHPRLFQLVSKHMVHQPCGEKNGNKHSTCLDEFGVCTKKFPKTFRDTTEQNVNGYPEYSRPEKSEFFYIKRKDGSGTVRVDNSYVVPYNAYLLLKYGCHINVKICASVKSVKYIYKYIYKGFDSASIRLRQETQVLYRSATNYDEIQAFVNCRYVSPPEAMWRIHEYPLHDRSHSIIRLAVHLEDQQNILHSKGHEKEALKRHNTTLTAWLQLNKTDVNARHYKYTDIPFHYVFNKANHKWLKRKKQMKIIPRMYTVSPSDPERYFFRMLLLHVQGCRSFADIRTVNGIVYPTYRKAARERNLLDDDSELEKCINEAAEQEMPQPLRLMFAFLLVFTSPTNPLDLWHKFNLVLADDYLMNNIPMKTALDKTLYEIQKVLNQHGKRCSDFNLPSPTKCYASDSVLSAQNELTAANVKINKFNSLQKLAFKEIMKSVSSIAVQDKCYFIDAPGGTGKSFLFEAISGVVRSEGNSPIVVATTGIAATLLKGGKTAHSVFKIPIPAVENSTSSIKINSLDAMVIKNATIVLWDEITMATAHMLAVVDRLLRFIKKVDVPFGAITFVCAGDFRQTLPVVKRGDASKIIESTIKRSSLWKYFKILKLRQNKRLDQGQLEFANYLLKVGSGATDTESHLGTDFISIPPECIVHEDIVDEIFGKTIDAQNISSLSQKVILCSTNANTMEINSEIVRRLDGESRSYLSADSAYVEEDDAENNVYPTEFINSLTPSGMPPFKLELKVGAIVILLRNLATKEGLCNGVRLVVKKLLDSVIVAEIITGSAVGKTVLIPRIVLDPSDIGLPFRLRRRQFPIRIGFALTINRAQGQTFNQVGLYLPEPVFGHGQIYVAFSRVKSLDGLKVKLIESIKQGRIIPNSDVLYTKNIVHKEIIDDN